MTKTGGLVTKSSTADDYVPVAHYETVADFEASDIDSAVSIATISGYSTAGAAPFQVRRVGASEPTHPWKFQTADGAWWEGIYDAGFVNVKWLGAVGDGSTDDQAALNNAAYFANHGLASVYLPTGKYKVTQEVVLSCYDSYRGKIEVFGDGGRLSFIVPVGTGVNGIHITDAGSGEFNMDLRSFGVCDEKYFNPAAAATNVGCGILSDVDTLVYACSWKDLSLFVHGACLKVLYHFNHVLENINGQSVSDHGCCIYGGNTVSLIGCYFAHCETAGKAAYRIVNSATLISCNGCDAGDYWGLFGGRANKTGTAQAGAAGSITLAAGVDEPNDLYYGFNITITAGTGSGQTRMCSGYTNSTKVATVSTNWTTPPDATSVYSVQDPVTEFQVTSYPSITMIGCNVEGWERDGLCFVQEGAFTMINGHFQPSATIVSFIRLYAGNAAAGHASTLINVHMDSSGVTRTGLADILSGFHPPDLLLINSDATGTNAFGDIYGNAVRYTNRYSGMRLWLPILAGSDPADGTGAIWVDGVTLKRGT